jgi:Ca2+-binding EF-hand superfamily protein
MGVSAEELAAVTAEQAFVDADVNHDGVLSFEEFKAWYSMPGSDAPALSSNSAVQNQDSKWLSLQEARRLTNLSAYSTEEVFEMFAEVADDEGLLSEDAFLQCFEQLVAARGSITPRSSDATRTRSLVHRLFAIFDADGNGVVDFSELASGLSVLCGGSRDDKVEAAFSLYDLNGDGFISLEEMTTYLTSVFKVLYETQPETRQRIGVGPEELAAITAAQCFADADVNHDGRLEYEEFKRWYTKSNIGGGGSTTTATPPTESSVPTSLSFLGLEQVREITGLASFEVEDIMEMFAEACPDGAVRRPAFRRCFEHIVNLSGGENTQASMSVVNQLFDVFDANKNGLVDFAELASGLSVMCGSDMDRKVEAAFRLYDTNGDGFISMEEAVSYISSIFKVMFATNADMKKQMECGPEQLASVTAQQLFEEADLNHDNKLSFDEFKKWCTQTL